MFEILVLINSNRKLRLEMRSLEAYVSFIDNK